MRAFITQDGNTIYTPDHEPEVKAEPEYHCDCHKRMGDDFWFLNVGSCLRSDATCSNPMRIG